MIKILCLKKESGGHPNAKMKKISISLKHKPLHLDYKSYSLNKFICNQKNNQTYAALQNMMKDQVVNQASKFT